jgi:hypothetical protein
VRRSRKRPKKAPLARTKKEKCTTKWCRNRKAEKITRYKSVSGKIIVYTGFLDVCWKCKSKRLKERHTYTYVLNMLRHSARKRKLPFTLTLDQFKEWCLQTGYLERRGTEPTDLTIDRIDWNDGYHVHNIRVITHEENCKQGADNTPRAERIKPDPDNEPF